MSSINKPNVNVNSGNLRNFYNNMSGNNKKDVTVGTREISDLTDAQIENLNEDIDTVQDGLEAFAQQMFQEYGIAISPKDLQQTFDTQISALINIKEEFNHGLDPVSTNSIQGKFQKSLSTAVIDLIKNPSIAMVSQAAIPSVRAGYANNLFNQVMDPSGMGQRAIGTVLNNRMQSNPNLANQVQRASGGGFPINLGGGNIGGFNVANQAPNSMQQSVFGDRFTQANFNNFARQAPAAANNFATMSNRMNTQNQQIRGMMAGGTQLGAAGARSSFTNAVDTNVAALGFDEILSLIFKDMLKQSDQDIKNAYQSMGTMTGDAKEAFMDNIKKMSAFRQQMTDMFTNIKKKIDDTLMNIIRKI